MTDKKFTDEEIIETLERCSKGGGCFRCAMAYEILEAKAKAEVEAYEEFAERVCEGKVSNDKTVIEAKAVLKERVGEEK